MCVCGQMLSEACGPDVTVKLLLPTVVTMGNDAVANVRFNVAKTLQKLGSPIVAKLVYNAPLANIQRGTVKLWTKTLFNLLSSRSLLVANTLETDVLCGSQTNAQQVRSVLEKLRQDSDIDVRFFATEATEGRKTCWLGVVTDTYSFVDW